MSVPCSPSSTTSGSKGATISDSKPLPVLAAIVLLRPSLILLRRAPASTSRAREEESRDDLAYHFSGLARPRFARGRGVEKVEGSPGPLSIVTSAAMVAGGCGAHYVLELNT